MSAATGTLLGKAPCPCCNCTVDVLHGKGDRSRTVGLDNGAWALLELWRMEDLEFARNRQGR